MARCASRRECRSLTLGRTRKIIPRPWYKERLLQPLPWVFAVLQYSENVLLLIDSRSCDLQDEVSIMGYGAGRGGVPDVIRNGRQDGRHLEFCFKLKPIGNTPKLQIFFA